MTRTQVRCTDPMYNPTCGTVVNTYVGKKVCELFTNRSPNLRTGIPKTKKIKNWGDGNYVCELGKLFAN